MRRVDSLEKTLILGGIGAGGEGVNRGWDGWMTSLTWWTWVWVNSGSWWWTGRPGVLRFMGSQRVGHDWVTELNWGHHRAPSWASWVIQQRPSGCFTHAGYICQCYSLSSSHLLLPPPSSQVRPLCLHLCRLSIAFPNVFSKNQLYSGLYSLWNFSLPRFVLYLFYVFLLP